jgi:hypothetical protein
MAGPSKAGWKMMAVRIIAVKNGRIIGFIR